LRRLRIGVFSVEDALELKRDSRRGDILERLLPPEAAVAHLERVDLDRASVRDLAHGRSVAWRSGRATGPVAVHDAGRLTAVAGVHDERLWPIKVFTDAGGPKGRRD
jgi:tRNA U55 pseudouridine synthase TruB